LVQWKGQLLESSSKRIAIILGMELDSKHVIN
jgi:hypothetical protein